jgi:GTP-binding protein
VSDPEALAKEAARLFSGRVEFLLSAPRLDFLPEPDAPEIAFCGR